MSTTEKTDSTTRREPPLDFIRAIIRDDLAEGRHSGVVTRFPPEPNGFLHIGHAKSIKKKRINGSSGQDEPGDG